MFRQFDPASAIARYKHDVLSIIAGLSEPDISRAIDALLAAWRERRRVYVLGNGGSAATAAHFACDLGKGTRSPGRHPFQVLALTDNVPMLTAWANDVAYEDIFANQLAGIVEPDDLVIGISTSGNSPNVLKAIALAREAGARTIGLVGYDGGRLMEMVDIAILAPACNSPQCEDAHHVLLHLIATVLRENLALG